MTLIDTQVMNIKDNMETDLSAAIDRLLPRVEMPSRYLGTEINRIRKDPASVRLRMALAFPDLYEIGTSHFGMQILYTLLNKNPDIAAERVFTPAPDMEAALRENALPLFSLETRTPLADFHIIGASLLYELNYTNLLTMLSLSGIPFRSSERTASRNWPLLVAGGPCMCNPEPVADLMDAIVIGDGEEAVPELARTWMEWKASRPDPADGSGRADQRALLRRWARIPGVYIPSFYSVEEKNGGRHVLLPPRGEAPAKTAAPEPGMIPVRRTVAGDLDKAVFPDRPVIPFGKTVHDRLRLEPARGCTRGCRFCQAGMIYRPVRERAPDTLVAQAEAALAATGYEDISLMSLSTGDYSCISPLIQELMVRHAADRVAVSLPSLRAGTLTPELMDLIRTVRKTGFTIAPEAGSQRLRDVINKNITEDDIVSTVISAFDAGWRMIKCYFMIGLPTETDADIAGMIRLVHDLKRAADKKKKGAKISVSVGIFIPKPHTPFQWHRQISLEESRARIEELRLAFRKPGIQFKWQPPEISRVEALFSRGDRRMADVLIRAWELGCRLDGWTDHFRYDRWKTAAADCGLDLEALVSRKWSPEETLPWDHIDIGVSRQFHRKEWEKAIRGERTEDCRFGSCAGCGVCDFDRIRPVVFSRPPARRRTAGASAPVTKPKTFQVRYEKRGDARFFGHLEMVSLFLRAIRRAEVPVAYSGGFHPLPKVAFTDPIPLGFESAEENYYMTVTGPVDPLALPDQLNPLLPRGLRVTACFPAPPRSRRMPPETIRWEVRKPGGAFDPERLVIFQNTESLVLKKTSKKGKTKIIDLVTHVRRLKMPAPGRLCMEIRSRPTLRPTEVVSLVFGEPEESIREMRVVKLAPGTAWPEAAYPGTSPPDTVNSRAVPLDAASGRSAE